MDRGISAEDDKLKFIRGSISFYLGREKMKLHLPFHMK